MHSVTDDCYEEPPTWRAGEVSALQGWAGMTAHTVLLVYNHFVRNLTGQFYKRPISRARVTFASSCPVLAFESPEALAFPF